jgi:hypothetical protein
MRLGAVALLLLWPAMAAVSDIDPNKTAGNPSAPVTVQVFSDFECPACKAFHDQSCRCCSGTSWPPARFSWCTASSLLPIHAHSREAANYAVAAAHLGLYQPVADALFRDQVAWSLNGKVWETVASVLTLSQQKKVKAAADERFRVGRNSARRECGPRRSR